MTNTDHQKVNAWMLGNGWEWEYYQFPSNKYDGYWTKKDLSVSHEAAAEFYQMAEMELNSRIEAIFKEMESKETKDNE